MKDAGGRGPAAPRAPAVPARPVASPIAPRVAPHAPLTAVTPTPGQAKVSPKPPAVTPAHVPPAHVAPVAPTHVAAAHVAPTHVAPVAHVAPTHVAPVAHVASTPEPAPAKASVSSAPPSDDSWESVGTDDVDVTTASLRPPMDVSAGLDAPAVQAIVKTAVDAATIPLLRAIHELEKRIVQLEQRPAQVAPAVTHAKAADAFAAAMARPVSAPPPPMAAVAAAPPLPAAVAAPAPAPVAPAAAAVARSPYALPTPGPVLDLAAIEHDNSIQIDMPFDGARRRRRLAFGVVGVLLLGLGSLLAVLIHSYMR